MSKFFKLVKWEFLVQNKIHNFVKYLVTFFLFCTICIALINSHEDISKFGIVFVIIYMPIAMFTFPALIVKADLEDGSLEAMLTYFTSIEIILAKFLAILANACIACLINVPIIFIAFNPTIKQLVQLTLTLQLELLFSCALVVLIAAVQSYFRSNTNFLPQLLMTLMLPAIIFSGLIIQNNEQSHLMFILLGIDLLSIPLMLVLASHLVQNIFDLDS